MKNMCSIRHFDDVSFQYKCIRRLFSPRLKIETYGNITIHPVECVAHAVCCGTAFKCMRATALTLHMSNEIRTKRNKKKETTKLQNT